MGFSGRLLVHPAQVAPTRRGFAPSEAEAAWARRLFEAAAARAAAGAEGGAWRFEDSMVDEAVLRQGRAILGVIGVPAGSAEAAGDGPDDEA